MSTEESGDLRVISPTPSGSAQLWALLARISKWIKRILPSAMQATLNRQLWLFSGLAVLVPAAVALYEGGWLTVGAVIFVTLLVGGGIYGEMYVIIETLQTATASISDEQYHFEIESVVKRIEDVNAGITEINGATDSQARTTEEVDQLIERIAEISDETADEAQSVSASSEEQTAALTDMTETVTDLADEATQLQSLLEDLSVSKHIQADGQQSATSADS